MVGIVAVGAAVMFTANDRSNVPPASAADPAEVIRAATVPVDQAAADANSTDASAVGVNATDAAATDAAATDAAATDAAATDEGSIEIDGCTMAVVTTSSGDTGESVECVQKALAAAGSYDGPITGTFDEATEAAARDFQQREDLHVDGIVGGRTATSLGIWPGDESFVVRTPPPAPGAVDLWGVELSSVGSAGADAPPMPPDTGEGTGKRVVYSRAGQRVWAVDDEERVVRSYLITGSQYNNELPGNHKVYSRSEVTTAWNGEANLPLMIRWLDTERGAIGFHGIPTRKSTGEPYQTDAELGQKLSGGCQRQSNLDAAFLWSFAEVGTPVIVV